MANIWAAMRRWQKNLTTVVALVAGAGFTISTIRAGFLWPMKQDMKFSSIESTQSNLVTKVDEIARKQDEQHDLLIRMEEKLWPRARVGVAYKEKK